MNGGYFVRFEQIWIGFWRSSTRIQILKAISCHCRCGLGNGQNRGVVQVEPRSNSKYQVSAKAIYSFVKTSKILVCASEQSLSNLSTTAGTKTGKNTMSSCTANTMMLSSEHIWKRARSRVWTYCQSSQQTHQMTSSYPRA